MRMRAAGCVIRHCLRTLVMAVCCVIGMANSLRLCTYATRSTCAVRGTHTRIQDAILIHEHGCSHEMLHATGADDTRVRGMGELLLPVVGTQGALAVCNCCTCQSSVGLPPGLGSASPLLGCQRTCRNVRPALGESRHRFAACLPCAEARAPLVLRGA